MRTRLQIPIAIAVLGIAAAGGWVATNAFQRTVPLVPGVQGCYRLVGSARQISCLSDEFQDGAAAAADGQSGTARTAAVIAYVRRADRLATSDTRLADQCHPAMHELGRSEGRRAAKASSAPDFPGGASQLCTAGYVHGLAEGYLVSTPDADVAAVYPTLCHDPKSQAGCTHGVGHALLRAHAKERSGPAVSAAITGCATLPTSRRADCHDGVYMELAMRTKPEPVSVDQYVDVCSSTTDVGRELSCWGYLNLSFASNDRPLDGVPAACAKASGPSQFTCLEGYGRQIGIEKVGNCEAAAPRAALVERCIEGAVGLQVGSGHVSRSAANTACGSLDADRLVRYCRGAVTRYESGRAAVEAT